MVFPLVVDDLEEDEPLELAHHPRPHEPLLVLVDFAEMGENLVFQIGGGSGRPVDPDSVGIDAELAGEGIAEALEIPFVLRFIG